MAQSKVVRSPQNHATQSLIDSLSPDPDKTYVQTGKDQKVTAFYIPDFQYSVMGKFIIYRLLHDRDVKILITSKGKTTGTGKTTLAIIIAKWINKVRNELFNTNKSWSAENYSFMDTWDYLKSYRNSDRGDTLITDELEYMADRRRHMTDENVKFSQAWNILRYRNVVTIGTAPGLMDLEKRVPEGADIWINVQHKGRANVYYITVDDFQWVPVFKRLKMKGYREAIRWEELQNDSDYEWLKSKKEDLGVPGIDDDNRLEQSDLDNLEQNIKNETAKNLLINLHHKGGNLLQRGSEEYFTQSDIAEIADVSQQQVSVLKKELEKEGII